MPLKKRTTLLANGDLVSLEVAAAEFSRLGTFLELPDTEWDAVYYLRQLCLGETIEPEQLQELIRARLVNKDGEPFESMKSVVLSAVRGTGRVLHLDSPFTDATDEAIAQFINARDHLEFSLEEADFGNLLQDGLKYDQQAIKRAINELPLPPDFEAFSEEVKNKILAKEPKSNLPPDAQPKQPKDGSEKPTTRWQDRQGPRPSSDDMPPLP